MSGKDSNPFGEGADVDVDAAKWLLKALDLMIDPAVERLEHAGAMRQLVETIDGRLDTALDKLMGKPTPNDAEA